jgi:hypothetical protein
MQEVIPRPLFKWRRERIMETSLEKNVLDEVFNRANYYNKLVPARFSLPSTQVSGLDRSKSRYFLDLNQYLKYFPANLKIDYLFGDIRDVPATPTVLKSRPIGCDNANSVVLNLNKLRHFGIQRDQRPWTEKKPMAVWRGRLNNPLRKHLVKHFQESAFCDVGHVNRNMPEFGPPKPFMSKAEQFAYRYLISVEGVDVATNLKWIMASNSICLMPKPRFETWFMEGRLEPDRHFVLVKDDFSDLEDKINQLEANPAWAHSIIKNANDYVNSFYNKDQERLISLLILQKYFEATGQLPQSAFSDRFFAD